MRGHWLPRMIMMGGSKALRPLGCLYKSMGVSLFMGHTLWFGMKGLAASFFVCRMKINHSSIQQQCKMWIVKFLNPFPIQFSWSIANCRRGHLAAFCYSVVHNIWDQAPWNSMGKVSVIMDHTVISIFYGPKGFPAFYFWIGQERWMMRP